MMYLTQDNDKKLYSPMFNNLWKWVWGPHDLDENEKPIFQFETGIKFLSWVTREEVNFSIDLTIFKCKPTTLNRPPQLLIAFNPPISLQNNIFSDLRIWREREGKEIWYIPTGQFTYLYSTSLDENLSNHLTTEQEDKYLEDSGPMDKF